jgi:hypothetical protein
LKYLGVHHITYRMSFSVQLISVSIDCVYTCLNVPSWLVAVSLFCAMRSTSIDCDDCWMSESEKKIQFNHLMIYCNPSDSGNNYWIPHKVLFIVHSKEKILFNKQLRIAQNNWHSAVITIYRGILPENPNTLTERKTIWPKKKYIILQWKHFPDIFQCWIHRLVCFGKVYLKVQCHIMRKW